MSLRDMSLRGLRPRGASPATDRPAPGRLTPGHYRIFALTSLGGALEIYDFLVFVFFVPVLAQVFFPPDLPRWVNELQAFTVFGVGFLVRPLGGVVFGHFGDRLGRKRMFAVSVLLMVAATTAIGLLPDYGKIGLAAPLLLCLLRIVQGIAVGGEVAGGYLFVAEHAPRGCDGRAVGTLSAGVTIGNLAGVGIAALVHAGFSPQEMLAYGWRIPFLVGAGLGIGTLYLRRMLHETPVFQALESQRALSREFPLRVVLRSYWRDVLYGFLVAWLFVGFFVVVLYMAPTLLQNMLGMSATQALAAGSLATICGTAGCLTAGQMFDRLPSRLALALVAGAGLVGGAGFFVYLQLWPHHAVALYAVAGFCTGLTAGLPVLLVRRFPPAIAYSGVSVSYNGSFAVFGGLTPALMAVALTRTPYAPAIYLGVLALVGLTIAALVRTAPIRSGAA